MVSHLGRHHRQPCPYTEGDDRLEARLSRHGGVGDHPGPCGEACRIDYDLEGRRSGSHSSLGRLQARLLFWSGLVFPFLGASGDHLASWLGPSYRRGPWEELTRSHCEPSAHDRIDVNGLRDGVQQGVHGDRTEGGCNVPH